MSTMVLLTQRIPINSVLSTPSGRSEFQFAHIDGEKILVKTRNGTFITIPGPSLEETPKFLEGRGWVLIGASHSTSSTSVISFDDFLKNFSSGVSIASYAVAILERAKIIEVDHSRPSKIRLLEQL
jgi:hypothetical protein